MTASGSSQLQWEGRVEAHPMETPRGKLARAFQHADFLRGHCEAFAVSQPTRLDVRYDEAHRGHVVFMEGRPPPLYLGLILGEVVHDLRSALDHLAWQLALDASGNDVLEDPRVATAITFPIASRREQFNKHRSLQYFDQQAVAHMEALQPYHNEGSPLVHPLALLQELSNTDKHRALRPALGQIRIDDLRLRCSETVNTNDIKWLAPR